MLSDAPLIKGMPSLETPVLLWLYYVRHQLYFLNEIEKEIEETEREIDGKVYELYGLTEEEIRVVENINKK